MAIHGETEDMGLSASQQLPGSVALAKSLAISSVFMFSGVWGRASKVQCKHTGLRSKSKPTFPQPPLLPEFVLCDLSPLQGLPSATSFLYITSTCEEGFYFPGGGDGRSSYAYPDQGCSKLVGGP